MRDGFDWLEVRVTVVLGRGVSGDVAALERESGVELIVRKAIRRARWGEVMIIFAEMREVVGVTVAAVAVVSGAIGVITGSSSLAGGGALLLVARVAGIAAAVVVVVVLSAMVAGSSWRSASVVLALSVVGEPVAAGGVGGRDRGVSGEAASVSLSAKTSKGFVKMVDDEMA
jgi:hypothetical protein